MKYLVAALFVLATMAMATEAVFVTVETGTDESVIYKMNPDGSSPTLFFSFDNEPADSDRSYITDIDISPTGRYLAVTSDHDGYYNPARRNIYAINSEGTNWRQITPAPNADKYWYSGPTGTISGQVTWGGDYVSFATICCDGVITKFSSDALGNFTITGVPTGGHLIFAYTWGGVEMVYGWNYVNVAAGVDNPCDIINVGYSEPYGKDQCQEPSWSPDESHIYYKSSLGGNVFSTSVPGDWSDDSILVDDWGTSFYGFDVRHSDGKIVYAIDDDGLYLANANGTGRTQIFAETYEISMQYPCNPRWAPNGVDVAFLAFYYTPTESGNIVCAISTTTGEIWGYFGWGSGVFPSVCGWSPDGNYVLTAVHEGDWSLSELWKVNPSTPTTDAALIYGPASIIDAAWGDMNPSAVEEYPEIPQAMEISAYPNPFNSAVTISIGDGLVDRREIPRVTSRVEIFDIAGRIVRDFGETRTAIWDGSDDSGSEMPSGVYFVKANYDGRTISRKIVLMK